MRLIDRNRQVPASGLCHQFIRLDVTKEKDPGSALDGVDLVIPALENEEALTTLAHWTEAKGIPFAFNLEAYAVSASKLKSNRLFENCHIPAPETWPHCDFPVIAKPDKGSGSNGVRIFHQQDDLEGFLRLAKGRMVIQQFLQGPSYSIEILGTPGQYTSFQVTGLEMDAHFDCKRVVAPTKMPDFVISDFQHMAEMLANAMELKGLMDVEVVLHENKLKVLEIDARLPSQTPATVFWSTGINMVERMGDLFMKGVITPPAKPENEKSVIYEHIRATPGILQVVGERAIRGARPLGIRKDFFGANEAITDFASDRHSWIATLIFCGKDRESVLSRRRRTIRDIMRYSCCETYQDPFPSPYQTGKKP